MEAEAALAFVAKREGTASMPSTRWAHVMSLELGWMSPNQAKTYVAACAQAGLLEDEGDALRLTYDEDTVDIPPRSRPDPDALPEAHTPRPPEGFEAWAKQLADHTGRELGEVLADVAALQERMGGLLHAEASVLRLLAEEGLDIRAEATAELERLMQQGGGQGSEG